MKNKNDKIFHETEKGENKNTKPLNHKRLYKNKSNDILDTIYFLKQFNNNLNKSKNINEFMKLNSLSHRNGKNKLLLGKQNKNISDLPIFLSSMTNKSKFQSNLHNINNNIIKSYSNKNFKEKNNYEILNNNNQNKDKKLNIKLINKENLKLNFEKIKEMNKTININRTKNILKNESINNKFKSRNLNKEKIIYNNIGSINSYITSSNENYTFNPNKNILYPKLSFENKKIINNIINEKLNGQKNTNSLDINEFLAKDIKNNNIKKLLKFSFKENKKIYNSINKNILKLKNIHNFQTILSDEERYKSINYKNILNSNINSFSKRNEILNDYKNIKSLNTDRLIMSYSFKNKNKSVKAINQPLIKNSNFFESKEILNKKTNNSISKNNNLNNNQKVNDNIINNIKNKNKIDQKRVLIIEDKKKKKKKKSHKKIKAKRMIQDQKFFNIFNIKKNVEIYSKNHFLNFLHSELNEKMENIDNLSRESKMSLLINQIKEIHSFKFKEKSKLKEYNNNINKDVNNLKKNILQKEINIKYNTCTITKSKILFYELFYLYILPFKKLNLKAIFTNYLFKSVTFSTIYLPVVSIKKNQKRQGIRENINSFSNNLSNSLYPDIKWKFMNSKKPKNYENFVRDFSLIIRLINLDFDNPKNELDIKDIINKINKPIKMNRIVNLLSKEKNSYNQKRKTEKLDLSFMPQFYKSHSKTNIYEKMNSKRVNSWSNINNFKRNYFPHSLLDKKKFFDVPKRSFNIKINYAISNALLYNRVCDNKIDFIKKDKNYLIKNFADDDIHIKEIINKKCIEKLKIAIEKSNIREGKKMIDDYYKILREIKDKKYIEETLRMLIIEGEEELFCEYLEKIYTKIDINCIDHSGNTFLILSVKEGLKNIIKNLLEKKVKINIRNKNGNTALHFALGNKFFYIADQLKKHGADETILNKKGLSPWECFGKIGDPTIFEI